MSHRLVAQPSGLFALFSTICDDIIEYDVTREEFIKARVQEAAEEARRKAERWLDGNTPGRRHWSVEEIVEIVRDVHGEEAAQKTLGLLTDAALAGKPTTADVSH